MTKEIVPQTISDDKSLLGAPTDALKAIFETALNDVMRHDVAAQLGAQRYERTGPRDLRNGTRLRRFDTRMGTLDLEIPRLREGSYFPGFLEHRQRSELALICMVQEAFVAGVSTRKMEKLVEQLGVESLSKSQVSELCASLDEAVTAFRTRPLTGTYPYVMFDAVYEKVRIGNRVQSQAVVACYGVNGAGARDLLGLDVVDTESYESWSAFFRSLLDRGLKGVKLIISDAHAGLKKAIQEVFVGATWQRCRIHFMRNVLAPVPKHLKPIIAAELKRIYHAAMPEEALRIADEMATRFSGGCSRAMNILLDGVEDTLAYLHFPSEHWSKVSSTNPIERLNREIRRRTRSIGVFPNVDSAIRLIGMILLEQTEEWSTQRGYMSTDSMQLIT